MRNFLTSLMVSPECLVVRFPALDECAKPFPPLFPRQSEQRTPYQGPVDRRVTAKVAFHLTQRTGRIACRDLARPLNRSRQKLAARNDRVDDASLPRFIS